MQASESGSLNHRWRGWTSRPYGLQQNGDLLFAVYFYEYKVAIPFSPHLYIS